MEKRKRPTTYTEELGEEICRRLADGQSLRRIQRDPTMPARETVRRWQRERPAFAQACASARDDMIEALAEDALETAELATADDVALRKIYIDTVKWYVGLLAPRRAPAAAEPDDDAASIGEAIERGRERVRRLREAGSP